MQAQLKEISDANSKEEEGNLWSDLSAKVTETQLIEALGVITKYQEAVKQRRVEIESRILKL